MPSDLRKPPDHTPPRVFSYVFDVRLERGLDATQLEDLADLLRRHADPCQLAWIVQQLEGLLPETPCEPRAQAFLA